MGKYSFFSLSVILAIITLSHAAEYAVVNHALGTPGGERFDNEIGAEYAKAAMAAASDFILNTTFQETSDSDRKNITSVTLYINKANKNSSDHHHHHRHKHDKLRVSGGKIHVSDEFIEGLKEDARREFTGVVYHVMTHVWQWKGNGEAPKWLTEGIADYVRLEAGYAPEGWVKPGGGDSWTDGHDVAARFLEHCNELEKGFVGELNKRMRTGYTDGFFVDILGKTLDQLWIDYKAQYMNKLGA